MHTFTTMGTVVSLLAADDTPVGDVEAVFADADARFSLYRPESEASRIARGELALTAASEQMRTAYTESLHWRTATDGAFTPHRPDGVIDLAGTVKATTMAHAARLLGDGEWLLDVGGDVLTSPADSWTIGIVDPGDRQALLCIVPLGDGRRAIATSGTAERGEHVWRRPAEPGDVPFVQVSVIAEDIVTADVLATAILAGGVGTLDTVTDRFDVDVLTIDAAGALLVTDRLRRLIAPASRHTS
ncbi:FAD:protein FMN transferase [Rathayibacter sp. AY1E3]|uniref:FAD:protein FMN transferase n=1 Tax=Rathayibacter sp. AY1E3 TaxID=2080551 RepID=UPI0021571E61|nr:FAD:protein FMN transferase [Rathayibacter sp. AY1E3]